MSVKKMPANNKKGLIQEELELLQAEIEHHRHQLQQLSEEEREFLKAGEERVRHRLQQISQEREAVEKQLMQAREKIERIVEVAPNTLEVSPNFLYTGAKEDHEYSIDDQNLDSDLEKVSVLYQQIPGEPVSQEFYDSILKVADEEADRRRRRSWLVSLFGGPFGGRQITAIATLSAVVAFSFFRRNAQQTGPPDLLATRGLAVGESDADHAKLDEKISKAFARISEIEDIEPASSKWNSHVDQLMKSEIPQFEEYKSLATKLEAAGDSEKAERVRNLAAKLEYLFVKRNPDWLKEVNKGE